MTCFTLLGVAALCAGGPGAVQAPPRPPAVAAGPPGGPSAASTPAYLPAGFRPLLPVAAAPPPGGEAVSYARDDERAVRWFPAPLYARVDSLWIDNASPTEVRVFFKMKGVPPPRPSARLVLELCYDSPLRRWNDLRVIYAHGSRSYPATPPVLPGEAAVVNGTTQTRIARARVARRGCIITLAFDRRLIQDGEPSKAVVRWFPDAIRPHADVHEKDIVRVFLFDEANRHRKIIVPARPGSLALN